VNELYANSTQQHGTCGHWWKRWTRKRAPFLKPLETAPSKSLEIRWSVQRLVPAVFDAHGEAVTPEEIVTFVGARDTRVAESRDQRVSWRLRRDLRAGSTRKKMEVYGRNHFTRTKKR
jgi:hypothetical protein